MSTDYQAYLRAAESFRQARGQYEAAKASGTLAKLPRGAYSKLAGLYAAMRSAAESARYTSSFWRGAWHWAPSGWDTMELPLILAVEARDIGLSLRTRLEAEWPEERKCACIDYDFWPDAKEQHRILVGAYMRTLPDDDPDIVRYNGLHDRAHEYRMPEGPAPGQGQSRAARYRRKRRARVHA